MEDTQNKWKKREVACLWSKKDFHTGKLDISNLDLSKFPSKKDIPIIMFPNRKQNETNSRPAFNIYLSEFDDKNQGGNYKPKAQNTIEAKTSEAKEGQGGECFDEFFE